MNKIPLAESALNRLLNFMDDLDMQGAVLDQALAAPPGEMPAVEGMDAAIVAKGLGLAPNNP